MSVQASLQRDEPLAVFDVQTDVGSVLAHGGACRTFDGRVWSPDSEPATLPIEPGAILASDPVLTSGETTEVTSRPTSELALPWLPLPYPPRRPTRRSTTCGGTRRAGRSCSRTASNRDDLHGRGRRRAADARGARANEPPTAASPEAVRNTATPDAARGRRRSPRSGRLASRPTTTRSSAIQDRFTDPKWGFTYDETVPGSDERRRDARVPDRTRTGFCQQFASAMAVMLRTLGIPAGLAVGFTPGEPAGSSDRLTVTPRTRTRGSRCSSRRTGGCRSSPPRTGRTSWPTPTSTPTRPSAVTGRGASRSVARGPEVPAARASTPFRSRRPPNGRSCGPEVWAAPRSQGPTRSAASPTPRRTRVRSRPGTASPRAPSWRSRGCCSCRRSHAWRRRRRLRRAASSPRSLILATYDVFTDRAAELGHPRAPGQTLEEYRRAVAQRHERDRSSTTSTRSRVWPPAPPTPGREPDPGDAEAAGQASEAVVRAMRRRASLAQRLTGPYRRR